MKTKLTFLVLAGLQGLAQASTTDVSAFQTQQTQQAASARAPFAQLVFGGFFTLYDFATPIVTANALPLNTAAPEATSRVSAAAEIATLPVLEQVALQATPIAAAEPLLTASAFTPAVSDVVELPVSLAPTPTGGVQAMPLSIGPVATPIAEPSLEFLAVPEPSSLVLAVAALGLLGGTRKQSRGLLRMLPKRLRIAG